MKVRYLLLSLGFLSGCHLGGSGTPVAIEAPIPRGAPPRPASPVPDAADGLDRAADCIEKGDPAGAIAHLQRHLRQFPEQIMIRAYLAELLLKADRLAEAQDQYERFLAEAHAAEGPARKQVVHGHTRLMEIAQKRDDDYHERLHRGIGMVLLVRQLDEAGESDEPAFRERMLCKAATELGKASRLCPDEARPHWYLVEVWTKLAQPRPAEQALKQARSRAELMPLPRSEQRSLMLARK